MIISNKWHSTKNVKPQKTSWLYKHAITYFSEIKFFLGKKQKDWPMALDFLEAIY